MIKTYDVKALEAFPLVVTRGAQSPYVLHRHDFVELVIILGGRGIHYNERDAYEVITGDCFVVSGAHGYRETENLELANVLFYPSRLELPLRQARKITGYHAFFALEPQYRHQHRFRNRLRLTPRELLVASTLVDQIAKELDQQTSGYEFIATALLMELIGYLSRAYAQTSDTDVQPLLNLGCVLSHLEQHYMELITLDDLAHLAHVSCRQLNRAFRKVTGHAPMDYLIRLRIQRACELLRLRQLNVTEISQRVGFNDSNYFTRQFRRVMACSPRTYTKLQPPNP